MASLAVREWRGFWGIVRDGAALRAVVKYGLLWLGGGLLAQERFCPVSRSFLRLGSAPVPLLRTADTEDTLWVPVAFHIVASVRERWMSGRRIADQLDALNRDFAQARIQFYLPARGPQGEPTCGITWHISPLAQDHNYESEEEALKRLALWPTDSFVNIWVVESIRSNTIGYARALSDETGLGGVVLVQSITGNRAGTLQPYNWGRTAVHEMGHVLSLLHPFEGGCAGLSPDDCSRAGDEICDTPGQLGPHFGCPAIGSKNTCPDFPTDLPDPVDNLMGYVDDSCMTRFTPLQVQRLRAYLLSVGATLISPENRAIRGNALLESSCEAVLALPAAPPAVPQFVIQPDRIEVLPPHFLTLYDLTGRHLREGYGSLSLEGLAAGWYVVRITGLPAAKRFFHAGL